MRYAVIPPEKSKISIKD